jgi:flagellin
MALGVLNNLSAIYAETNLNNTSNSLQTVLQQLSSGSRINSGADDAAGLSLVNGLAANSAALTQSSTNATEGVGLLGVADGALSQVTTLLNRAITLATEASNGTLNTSQEAAANQEYQSILSEINNIGSTTTYNQNQVFTGNNSCVDIYTGDSSVNGASVDSLYFAKLSSSSVGDVGGSVTQSAKGNWIDLSKDASGTLTTAATTGDTLTAGNLKFVVTSADGTKSTNVMSINSGVLTYVKTPASGTATTTTETLTTTGTVTVADLMKAINTENIPGVTATFATAKTMGLTSTTVASGDTGLQLSNTNANVSMTLTTNFDDTTSGATAGAGLAANTAATTTISYQYATGGDTSVDLSTTDLSSQSNSQSALAFLNQAVTALAAQDGYLGAQINTLNSVSHVMSTQQENVVSAQNAAQATDYASATSNMSKYEILTQTGISALAQANSIQKEVTKLLQ